MALCLAKPIQRRFTMPDATNDDGGGGQQPSLDVNGEPRNALPTSIGSVAPCSHRQLQDDHVALICPNPRPNTVEATTQVARTVGAAVKPSPRSAGEEDAVTANAQQCTVSHQQLLSIYHHTESRREQVSKQLSADPPCRYDHIWAGRLEFELRGCESEELPSAGSDLIADTMKNKRAASTVLGQWHTIHHLNREARGHSSVLQHQ
ncbi:uncharacterized protein LOC144124215 [Amblyomma americanum]